MTRHTSNQLRYDVVVVGGGPGGASAAIRCAEAGLKVALVEREAFPRERVGETLHPGIEPLLEQLGVAEAIRAAGFIRHEGNWVERDGESRFSPYGSDAAGPWYGFQAWRAEFDAVLLARAKELGVTLFQPCRASRPAFESGRVAGVETSAGTLAATYLVDAAGGNHWLARRLGLSVEQHSPPLTARYGYAEGLCPAADGAPALRIGPDGWTWTARVRTNLYQWTRLSLGGPAGGRASAPGEFRGLKPRRGPRAADVTWRIVARPAGQGYFMTGDAAAVLDPASSHGVLRAVMSGMMAAHLAAQVLRGGLGERRAALAYTGWLREWFEHDAGKLKEFYGPLLHRHAAPEVSPSRNRSEK